jgi:hypothetical protein
MRIVMVSEDAGPLAAPKGADAGEQEPHVSSVVRSACTRRRPAVAR